MVLSNTFSYAPTFLGQLTVMKGAKNLSATSKEEYTTYTAKKCLFRKEPKLIEAAKKMFNIKKDSYIPSSLSAVKSNYLPILPFIKIPTLIIGGKYDEVNPLISTIKLSGLCLKRKSLYLIIVGIYQFWRRKRNIISC